MGETTYDELYRFMPVPKDQLGGSIFMLVVYGFMLLTGARYLSEGSEMLLELFHPGIVGGIVLPVLGALPDCLIIVVSGMGDRETAKDQVKVGLGTLAGSTIMLLTIAWAGSVIVGRCDFDQKHQAVDKTLTRRWDIFRTGVTADEATKTNAILMLLTTLLYFVVHIPALAGVTKDPKEHPLHKIPSIIGFVCCMVVLVVYITYQILYPELRRRVLKRRQRQRMLRSAISEKMAGGLFSGELTRAKTDTLFAQIDTDNSGAIDKNELSTLLKSLNMVMEGGNEAQDVSYLMREFDTDHQGTIDKTEFNAALNRWKNEKKHEIALANRGTHPDALSLEFHAETPADPLLDQADSDDEEEEPKKVTRQDIMLQAGWRMALGAFIAAFFADPMVGTVTGFAKATGIAPFFVAFVVTPLASNASELVSSLYFAMKKKKKNISLTFSQIYGAVTMNNTMCLGLFLLVVFIQELTWDYTAEVTAIVIPTIIVGLVGAFRTTFATWVALLVLPLYIVGILIVLAFQQFLPNVD